jgi:hypothetical protein
LAPNGLDVTTVTPLAIALEEFNAPAFGTINDGAIYYFADGNKSSIKGESSTTSVMKTPLVLSEQIAPAEHRKYTEDTEGTNAKN